MNTYQEMHLVLYMWMAGLWDDEQGLFICLHVFGPEGPWFEDRIFTDLGHRGTKDPKIVKTLPGSFRIASGVWS